MVRPNDQAANTTYTSSAILTAAQAEQAEQAQPRQHGVTPSNGRPHADGAEYASKALGGTQTSCDHSQSFVSRRILHEAEQMIVNRCMQPNIALKHTQP